MRKLTRRGELGVGSLPHDPLQTHARTHEPNADKRQRIVPRRVSARIRHTCLPALPDGYGCCSGKEGLDEGAEGEPSAGFAAYLVPDASDRCT